ncbi:autotransporter outer membrane beta-barrel domain-containing protein [Bradyrhizobium jicamae]|uniref:autotransporter outer membrane beta-barrel domain-containing protein n=1 Tax=Bradyrhizobium jicamae TaxID=280332 RepID=UPI001BA9C86D|nr:autotransporter outer membrane beta-barrel domain-containing protein [Bradyrhizobium jicamae]MBR0753701.1 autotransporter outer membrane beta-barrel domain-containing protein [Bradyrhizobium jicamae]
MSSSQANTATGTTNANIITDARPAPPPGQGDAAQSTFTAMTQFTQTLLDPFVGGRSATVAPQAYADDRFDPNAYAGGATRGGLDREVSAAIYGKALVNGAAYAPHWNSWASGAGGAPFSGGGAMQGSSQAGSRMFGTVVGTDYSLSPQTTAGFAMGGGGGANFGSSSFGGGSRSDLFQAGAFLRHTDGQAYVAGALAYGWQAMSNERMPFAGGDRLNAEVGATAYTGRVEGGYHFATPWLGIAAYAAGQVTSFNLPAVGDQAMPGANPFASAFGAVNAVDGRSELGMRTSKSFDLLNGLLTLRGRFAWVHDFNANAATSGAPPPPPGSNLPGLVQSPNAALTGASAELRWSNGWLAAATFESEFSGMARSFTGRGVVRYGW